MNIVSTMYLLAFLLHMDFTVLPVTFHDYSEQNCSEKENANIKIEAKVEKVNPRPLKRWYYELLGKKRTKNT